MAKVPLTLGAYTALSVIAECQRCVNLFPEKNPGDAEQPTTHYLTPGLTRVGPAPQQGRGRLLFTDTSGQLWAVVANKVYYIDPSWQWIEVGQIQNALTPVSMIDNGQKILLVDGSPRGYWIDIATHAFEQVSDPNFFGGVRVDYIDTFFVLNKPGTGEFYCSLSNSQEFDPLYFAKKTGTPDKIASLIVIHREIWLLGAQYGSEIWGDVGAADFPFQPIPGVFIQYGCDAAYSVAYNGLEIFWLGKDKNGKGFILKGTPYKAQVISTPAITQEISRYSRLDDAIGYCYQQDGHIFYCITFPTADKTWAFDTTTGQWHERVWTDQNGREHRDRVISAQFAYGKNLGLDWQNGNLYQLDPDNYTADGQPIVRKRGFPHLVADGKRMTFSLFSADMECGNMQTVFVQDGGSFDIGFSNGFATVENTTTKTTEALLTLRCSDDRGKSWWTSETKSMGAEGEYLTQPTWWRLGMARDRVFELSWNAPVKTALNGAYVEASPSKS